MTLAQRQYDLSALMDVAALILQRDPGKVQGVLEALRLMEAATYRSLATAAINTAITYVVDAANTLINSKFSQSALQRFGGKIMNALKQTATELLDLGWHAGGGQGDAPGEIVSDYLKTQQDFLATWITDIEDAKQLVGGVYRAQAYAQSLEQVYQRAFMLAKGQVIGMPDLPAYPRDGSTRCRTNCYCAWRIEKKSDTEYRAYWQLKPADHCEDCVRRSKDWNPLRIMLQEDGAWQFIAKSGPLEASND
jgi:hypothetical protein